MGGSAFVLEKYVDEEGFCFQVIELVVNGYILFEKFELIPIAAHNCANI